MKRRVLKMPNMTPYEHRRNQLAHRRPRDLFDYLLGDDFLPTFQEKLTTGLASFNADIRETDKEYLIDAEMPGLTKDDIKLSIEDDVLTVSAEKKEETAEEKGAYIRRERRFGSFTRSFRVENVKKDAINAKFENGVLKIRLPKQDEGVDKKQVIDID
jgi:HSP20 family protein